MAYWYTADEIVRITEMGLQESTGQALRWLREGINLLKQAYEVGGESELADILTEPQHSIDPQWDTLIAAAIRYRLRTLGAEAPRWTFKEPLEQMWFISGVAQHRVASAINLAPPELRRVGIMLPESALDY